MKPVCLFLVLLITTLAGFAQKIAVNKETGLVKVNNVASFYLAPVTVGFMKKDYSLQNLQHNEIAYLKAIQVIDYSANDLNNQRESAFQFTFRNTGNFCNISGIGFSVMKFLAKKIIENKLIVNNQFNPGAEKQFIVSNGGTIVKENSRVEFNETAFTPNENKETKQTENKPSVITIKENAVYNNNEPVGSFKKEVVAANQNNSSTETIYIYAKDDTKVATAQHLLNDQNADWHIFILSTEKKVTILYNSINPLEKLFKYLVDKNIL